MLSQPVKLTRKEILGFRRTIYSYYKKHQRQLPWRETSDPYCITVSELMLQQTQVDRVIDKYNLFIREFPDFAALAQASLLDVLRVWQGLGYNRRAKALREIAIKVMNDYKGILPSSPDLLKTFPGIGPYTAQAITAFAFNKPAVFIETNIRCVYIHFFFNSRTEVKDGDIFPVVEQTLDSGNPRKWYSALMDYGVMLKKEHLNPGRKSAHYSKQSRFEGSDRQ
ncbi:A/G-specific adenine glycosylase, partial [Candidatus Omnitrophota bacterium]